MNMGLEMRPGCERCGRDLPCECKEAYICSFECTFCLECAGSRLSFVCPNCGGELTRRPACASASEEPRRCEAG